LFAGYGSTATSADANAVPAVEVVSPPKKVSLLKALHISFACHFYGLGLLKLTADCARFVSPILLDKLVTFIETRNMAIEDGYFLVAGLTAAALTCKLPFCDSFTLSSKAAIGHFHYQNISWEKVIRTVRQGGEVYGAPRLYRFVARKI